jgi:uncharacterized protein
MPISPTYPGVYIEEIPSGVRTIVGVPTSITAFVGRTARGPTNEPTPISSQGDFDRLFGGLHAEYPLTYAVRDFYRNQGSQALIVRLFQPSGEGSGKATLRLDTLELEAASPGTWGNRLKAEIVYPDPNTAKELATRYERAGYKAEDFFDVAVWERAEINPNNEAKERRAMGAVERFRNMTVKEGPRRIDRVLEKESSLVRVSNPSALPASRPVAGSAGSNNDGANSATLDPATYSLSKDPSSGQPIPKTGLYALDKADLFNLLCIPPDTRDSDIVREVYTEAMAYCAKKRAMLIVDAPRTWGSKKETAAADAKNGLDALSLNGVDSRNAALYFPYVSEADPLREGQSDLFAPCGIVAGLYARTDRERGVWKAPAGIDAALTGPNGLQVNLTDDEHGWLNPLGINCLRSFPVFGRVVWGARTLRGADQLADEYKYIPIRRLALYIEESLYRGTQWVVFEPNDEPLWAQIRLNIGAFMHNLFRQGAFQGSSPNDAYLVKCDAETTTQNDRNLGIVNIVVGFAPLKPAEFVIIKIQQLAGKIEV